jgi:hypothetical protein
MVLTEAGIKTLVWDHPPSNPTNGSTPAASRATWQQRETQMARHPNLMSKGSTHFDPAWFHAIIRKS